MSMPRSRITSTTIGLIRIEGIVPALSAFVPCFLAKGSAIWLRPAFSTQTNSTGPLANLGRLEEPVDKSGNQTSSQWSYPVNVEIREISCSKCGSQTPSGIERSVGQRTQRQNDYE